MRNMKGYRLDHHTPVRCLVDEHVNEDIGARVESSYVDDARISTVFLGIDHNFTGHGPPLLFETTVFGGPLDGQSERYSTWDEAVDGHTRMLARVTAAAWDKRFRELNGSN